jgi:hypothetical protein
MPLFSFMLYLIMGNIVMSSPLLAPPAVISAVIALSFLTAVQSTTTDQLAYAQSSPTVTGSCVFGESEIEVHFVVKAAKPDAYYYWRITEDSSGKTVGLADRSYRLADEFHTGVEGKSGEKHTLYLYEDNSPMDYLAPRIDPNELVASGSAICPVSPPPPPDPTPPTLTVPDDMVVEATSEQGAQVTYTVTAQDNVDGNATLEEDGTTVTQDDIGGNITISCDPSSGSVFSIGETEVECTATDEASNTGTASFTVTVNPPPPSPPPTLEQAIDKLISTIQNLDDNVTQNVKTSLTAALKQVSNILSDNNPNNDESGCGRLGAFINHVDAAERRDRLTPNQADDLRTQAEDITIKLLDC